MKISLAISVLILAGFAALGWRQQDAVKQLREEQSALRAAAVALGLSVDEATGAQASRRASRPRLERVTQDVKVVAGDVIQLLKDIKAGTLEESGQSGVERISGIVERIHQLDAAQVRVLLDEIRNSPDIDDDGRRGVIGFAILTLAETRPEAAMAVFAEAQDLLTTKDGDGRRDVLRKLLGSWAAKDPLAALEWMKKNDALDPDLRDPETTRALIAGAARKDPVLAFQLAGELEGDEKPRAVREIVKAARTPDAQREMLTLLRGMADANETEGDDMAAKTHLYGFANLVQGMIEQGYAATQTWLVSAKLDPGECAILANGLASNKPTDDTGRWLEWMGGNLPPDKLPERISPLMSRWTSEDYRAAGDWLATTPDGAGKRTAVASYAETVAHYDPATAARWAETLPADANQDALLRKIHDQWQRQDADAAAAFAAKHGIQP